MSTPDARIDGVRAAAYRLPTERPESDGTLEWDAVTLVVAEADADGHTGLGYSYTDAAAAGVITGTLAGAVRGGDAMATGGAWWAMVRAVRNLGWPGISATAISALDVALWDLKAKLLGVCLADLLGRARDAVPIYGSGGLTSYPQRQLCEQLAGWVAEGIPRVKMKVGRNPDADPARVRAARDAIGDDAELFVDANGAYSRTQALALAETYVQDAGVSWFEEPVSSNDLDGLRHIRDRAPAGMAITAGEYGYDPGYFRRMLDAQSVDVLQGDVTRACGITGLQTVGALCAAYEVPFSAHCAPQIHAHAGCSIGALRHCEYFHTHARAERILFDGVLDPVDGALVPDRTRPGLGIELKGVDAERHRV
ncbi:MAG TPA: enolase C-terminal domain-like protein [Solirubrobacteraceae bacterium]|jgi:L-alanine-DL-glutamate epimerase-like enolase superfamily enzyme|nr:enolase C-terminal domain-like protein [Solirubrobacteraceae bacterium]